MAAVLLLAACGEGNKGNIEGGLFGDVPSILIDQAKKKADIKKRAKKAESEDNFMKLRQESEEAQADYEERLAKVLPSLEAVSVPLELGTAEYDVVEPAVMNVRRFSSESCHATIRFTVKATKRLPNEVLTANTIYHHIYVKLVDKDGSVVDTEKCSVAKAGGEKLSESLPAGGLLSCEISLGLKAKAEEVNGEEVFDVPERHIAKLVIIGKDEYESLSK